ncbi:MAG: NAD(P)H-dependent oxidoreductase, partial [Candidatus Micrarchaeota archaeon]
MEFQEIVMARYATKKFDGRPVPLEQMEKLLDMVRFSCSSFNLQPWKIKVVTDPAVKEKLLAASWNQPQITTCSHLLVLCADTDLESRAKLLYDSMRASGVPAENVAAFSKTVDGFVANMSAEKRLAWAQRQVYLALGNALNGAKSLGLDSCPMEGFDPVQYSKILGLPKNLVPTSLCPVGYA